MRRWVCPSCDSVALAPDRPRRDDTRRYCLPCSERTGRLVERSAPALERERAQRGERRAARSVRQRERAAAAEAERLTVGSIRLDHEARRLWRLSALREGRSWQRGLPELVVRRGGPQRLRASGHYTSRPRRIVVTTGSPESTVAALLHELTHAASGAGMGHSPLFWSRLRAAAAQAWPEVDLDFASLPRSRGWSVDDWIAERLRLAWSAP